VVRQQGPPRASLDGCAVSRHARAARGGPIPLARSAGQQARLGLSAKTRAVTLWKVNERSGLRRKHPPFHDGGGGLLSAYPARPVTAIVNAQGVALRPAHAPAFGDNRCPAMPERR
jgi:hypothetical protein